MLCSMVFKNRKAGLVRMIDFDLEKPITEVIKNMLDICERHVVGCKCVHCNSLEVLAYMIMVED